MKEFFEKMLKLTHEGVDRLYDIFKQLLVILSEDIKPEKFEYVPSSNSYRFDITGFVGTIELNLNMFAVDVKIFADEKTVVAECVLNIEGGFDERYTRISNSKANTAEHEFFMKISDIKLKTTEAADSETETTEEDTEIVDTEIVE